MEHQNLESLMPMQKESAPLYSKGRYLIFTKDHSDLTKGYAAEDINVKLVRPPELTENMKRIWAARYASRFPNGVARAGEFPGMLRPASTEGMLGLELFKSGFLDWNLTLPQGDEYDTSLERECMRPFFNIHHVPITADGQMIYVKRSRNRLSWHDTILCTHSWGTDVDKDDVCDTLLIKLGSFHGEEIFRQAEAGVRREINPYEESGKPYVPNMPLKHILKPKDVEVLSANCLTLPATTKDMGYHLCFTVKLNKEAGKLIEERNRYPMVGRIASYHSTPFTEDGMRYFFQEFKDRIAMTVEPAIIMACVQKFGEGFLAELPYEMELRGKKI